jgi:hypothetical protein
VAILLALDVDEADVLDLDGPADLHLVLASPPREVAQPAAPAPSAHAPGCHHGQIILTGRTLRPIVGRSGQAYPRPMSETETPQKSRRGLRRLAIAVGLVALETIAMRLRGYRIGRNVIVRCQSGHLFTTTWIPGGSVKSLRFLWWRVQRCPVGRHWTVITPVRESDLNAWQRRSAHRHRDTPLP